MDNDDTALDTLFRAARNARPEPTPDFLARLRADADREMPGPAAPAPRAGTPLMSRLGGILAASGLSGAAAFGVWIGFAMPDMLNIDTMVSSADDTIGLYAFLPGADLTALGE
jgi:hypothetical protein